jgi:hypothetical protein
VKNISSPTSKILYFSKVLNDLMPDDGQQAADYMLNFLIYTLLVLGKQSANLFWEQQYIQQFAHEEIIDKIDQWQNIFQIDNAFRTLAEGIEQHVAALQQGIASRSASIASHNYDYNSATSSRKKSSLSSNRSKGSQGDQHPFVRRKNTSSKNVT